MTIRNLHTIINALSAANISYLDAGLGGIHPPYVLLRDDKAGGTVSINLYIDASGLLAHRASTTVSTVQDGTTEVEMAGPFDEINTLMGFVKAAIKDFDEPGKCDCAPVAMPPCDGEWKPTETCTPPKDGVYRLKKKGDDRVYYARFANDQWKQVTTEGISAAGYKNQKSGDAYIPGKCQWTGTAL